MAVSFISARNHREMRIADGNKTLLPYLFMYSNNIVDDDDDDVTPI